MTGRRVLVAGGAGFVGSHLSRELVERGDTVTCIDNLSTSDGSNIQDLVRDPSFRFIRADVLEAEPAPYDLVYHLASPASPPHYRRLSIETMLVNSAGTHALLDVARAAECPFVLFSTSEVYGEPLEHPQRESYRGNVNPIGPRACYDEGKRFAEALTMEYHRLYGLPVTILRLFNTYGPGMDINDGRAIPAFVSALREGRPLPIQGDGQQTRSFCFVGDTVRAACVAGADPTPGGVFNVGNPYEVTILELAREMCRAAGVEPQFDYLPGSEDDPTRRCPEISRIRERYGWEPVVPLVEGIRTTMASYGIETRPVEGAVA